MLFNGVLAAAGLVMVVPLFIPSRWRGAGAPGAGQPEAASALSGNVLVSSDWAETAPIPQTPPTDLWNSN
jgi:hypothetical protein